MRKSASHPTLALTALALALAALAGCQAQRPDVAADFARVSGIENAITFRNAAEPLDSIPPVGPTLSPAQAVRLALAHDPRIQTSLARVRAAEADANQARLLPNPIVNIDFRYPMAAGENSVIEATLTADLIGLLQKPGQISAADHRLRGSAADALTSILDIISEVQQTYAAAQGIDAQIANAEHRDQILSQLRTLTQKRLDAGDGTRLDVLTLDAQIMQASLDLSDLQLQRTEQRLTLARLIGQPSAAIDWQLNAWEPPQLAAVAPEPAWLKAAMLNRPEIQSNVWELQALGDDKSNANLAPFVGGDMGAHAEHDPEWRLGPTFTFPFIIFDFGQAARAKAEALYIAATHQLAQQQSEVIQDVRLSYASYLNARRSLADVQDKLLPLQRRQLDLARLSYQSGDADLTTLLLAETDFQLALSKVTEFQQKVTVALVKLQRAVGGAAIADQVDAAATQPATTTAPAATPDTPTIAPASEPASESPTSRPAIGPAQ